MRRINGITLLFVLGIMSVLFGISMMNKVYKKPAVKNTDNGSTMVRYGETFEDQMTMRARPDSFTIPLTIVTTPVQGLERPPEVPTEAHVTLGEQNVRDITKYPEYKISEYKRNIFINNLTEIKIKRFGFNGFHPIIKFKKKGPSPELVNELQNLGITLENYVFIKMGDWKLPTKNFIAIQNNISNHDDEFALDLAIKDEVGKFTTKEKIKFTIEVQFRCTQMMIKHKAIYKLALKDILMYRSDAVGGGQYLPHDLPVPYENFFVINCGE